MRDLLDRTALIIGYGLMLACALFTLLWLWETVMRNVWRRCLDSKDFYAVVLEYAKRHHKKRVVTDE